MSGELLILVAAAASIGFFHTLLGPDHYLPFIVMSRSGKWSRRKTSLITFLCGLGHVMSSIVLGFIGVALGLAITNIEAFESFRGNLAAWCLIAFGLVYFLWGVKRAIRNKPHEHLHSHGDGTDHIHKHTHMKEHVHPHVELSKDSGGESSSHEYHEKGNEGTSNKVTGNEDRRSARGMKETTPWILFTIFIFGPCEPLIPLLMYPAARGSLWGLILVTVIFTVVTIATMMVIVLATLSGISFMPVKKMERYSHALAGATVFLCGISIAFLGL